MFNPTTMPQITTPPFFLRILLWLLLLTSGGNNDGNATPFPTYHQTARQRLMTDNMFHQVPSSISLPGPRFHGKRGFHNLMEASYTTGNPTRSQAFAIHPGYRRTPPPTHMYPGNSYGSSQPRSPFKRLFGSDIGQSSGVYDSFGKTGSSNEWKDSQRKSESQIGPQRNHPFSSLRLNPVSSVRGVKILGPDEETQRKREAIADSFTNFHDGVNPGHLRSRSRTRSNRAHTYEHENPFEKPISSSTFPLPDVNSPITLDLAEDQVNRVRFTKENRRLPPSRNFVYSPSIHSESEEMDSSEHGLSKSKNDNLSLDLIATIATSPRKGSKILSPAETFDLPSKKNIIRDITKSHTFTHGENNGENHITKEEEREGEGAGEKLQQLQPYEQDNDKKIRRGTKKENEFKDKLLHSGFLSNDLSDSSEVVDSITSPYKDRTIYGKSLLNNATDDGIKPPNIHIYLSTAKKNRPLRKQASNVKSELVAQTIGDDNQFHDELFDASIDNFDNTAYVNNKEKSKEIFDLPKTSLRVNRNEQLTPKDKTGNYDITTLTEENIHKLSGMLEEANNDTPYPEQSHSRIVEEFHRPLAIPATKRVTEETIDSGKRTVIDNETLLPTDHVGFILTDEYYDNFGENIHTDELIGTKDNNRRRNDIEQSPKQEYVSTIQNNTSLERQGSYYNNGEISDDGNGMLLPSRLGIPMTSSKSVNDQENYQASLFTPNQAEYSHSARPPIGSHFNSRKQETNDENDEYQNTIEKSQIDIHNPNENKKDTESGFRLSIQREDEGLESDLDANLLSSNTGLRHYEREKEPFLIDEQKKEVNTSTLSTNTDPTSLNFNILDAGEGSIRVRKVLNSYDPSHEDINVHTESLDTSVSNSEGGFDFNTPNAHSGTDAELERTFQAELLKSINNKIPVPDSNDLIQYEGNHQLKKIEHKNNMLHKGMEKQQFDVSDNNHNNQLHSDTKNATEKDVEMKKLTSGVEEKLAPAYNVNDSDMHNTDNAMDTTMDYESLLKDQTEAKPFREMSSNQVEESEADTSGDKGSTDTTDDNNGLFKPASSYETIDFPEPSSDIFSTSSGAFVNSDQDADWRSFPPSQQLASPFQSMFGKTLDQAESGSFGSLFNSLRPSERDDKTLNFDDSGSRGYAKYDDFQQHPEGSMHNRGGGFNVERRLMFDNDLGQIIERRPSLDLFGRKWR